MAKLILASQSKPRHGLLSQLGIPFSTSPADIDESTRKQESPRAYTIRIARAKAAKVAAENPGTIVLAADTPMVLGRRILQKPATHAEAVTMIKLLSGRRVHFPTAVAVADASGKISHKYVDGWLKIKPLASPEIEEYLTRCPEYLHLCGGIKLEKIEPWVQLLHGSYSGIIGLPLYETSLLLKKAGLACSPTTYHLPPATS